MAPVDSPVIVSGLMPHPPIVVPEVGRGREADARDTVRAMRRLSRLVVEANPDTLVLISPHSPRYPASFGIWTGEELVGDLSRFNAPNAEIRLPIDRVFLVAMRGRAEERKIDLWQIKDKELDHGAIVPLYFLCEAGWEGPTVVMGLNYPGERGLKEVGQFIADVARALKKRIAIIASGDMSHRLKPNSPSGYHPRSIEFDKAFVRLVGARKDDQIYHFDPELQELAGEDVVDSSIVAMAAAGDLHEHREVLSYEGPFGVGYSIAVFHSELPVPELPEEEEVIGGETLPAIARLAVENHVRGVQEPIETHHAEGYLAKRAGVFVTIRTRNDELRGCIGCISPTRANLIEETIDRAVMAAMRDARFDPVTEEELPDLTYEVSVLHGLQPVMNMAELDPERYGIIVRDEAGRQAVMLPGIESLDTVEKQVEATRRKAGIPIEMPLILQRFTVDKFHEHDPPANQQPQAPQSQEAEA